MVLLKNSFVIVLGIMFSAIFNYLFHIYVGRALGPAEYGVFGVLLALYFILSLPANGINNTTVKYAAKFNSEKQLGKIETLRSKLIGLSLIYGIIVLIGLFLFSTFILEYLKIDSLFSLVYVGIMLICGMLLFVYRGILQGTKKYRFYSVNLILESVARLILVVTLIIFGLKSGGAILSYALAYFVSFLLIVSYIQRKSTKKEKIDVKPIYQFFLLVLVINLIIQGIINVPTILIKHFMTAEFTGFWTAALTLAKVGLYIVTGISLVMFAEVAGHKNKRDQKKIFKKAFLLTLIGTVGIAIIFWVWGGLIIRTLYGAEFMGAIQILKWMGLAVIGISLLQLWLNYILAKRT